MKRILFGVLITLTAALLCSCQQEEIIPTDRFVGVNVVPRPSDSLDHPALGEPNELDGQYLLIPFDYDADGDKYVQALRSGSYHNTSFHMSVADTGNTYSMTAELYIGGQVKEGETVCIEPVYQRDDGTFYAVYTGYYLDDPLTDISYYDRAETRRVRDDDGKIVNETTSVSLTIRNAPLPDEEP